MDGLGPGGCPAIPAVPAVPDLPRSRSTAQTAGGFPWTGGHNDITRKTGPAVSP